MHGMRSHSGTAEALAGFALGQTVSGGAPAGEGVGMATAASSSGATAVGRSTPGAKRTATRRRRMMNSKAPTTLARSGADHCAVDRSRAFDGAMGAATALGLATVMLNARRRRPLRSFTGNQPRIAAGSTRKKGARALPDDWTVCAGQSELPGSSIWTSTPAPGA